MAVFAVGLTKIAVEGTLSLVKSAIEEDKKLKEKVQNDLVFITGEFEVMQSFLQVANRENAANDKVVLTLVRQLRTLAFDVEDCVEYVVHLDLDKSLRWGWLRRLWQTVNCRVPPLPLDVAVAEIKQLKARVEDMSQRNTRYNLILHGSDNNNKQQQPVTVMPLLAEEPPCATTTTYPSLAVFHDLRNAWKATGKWSSNMCNLQQELLISREGEDDHDLQVISVWGSSTITGGGGADIGTASIFRKVYLDPEICKNFKNHAWVKLTHPFNHDEFIKSLQAQFSVSSSSHQANTGVDFSWTRMKATEVMAADNLMEQRFLVVLEDVVTLEEWNVIRMYLPDSKNGSRILLSTPQLGIALLCTGEPYQVSELKNFSDDNQFLCAFSKKEKTPRGIGEFYRQLLRGHGVISVWGADDDVKSNLIDILYKGMINGWLEEIEGVADKSDHVDMLYRRRKFEWRQSSWVDVPDPFNLKVFAQRLFLNFHSDDIRAKKITEVGMKGEAGLIEWCCKFLSEEEDYPYVVVIYGLQSKDDWDLIERTFFSSKATTTKAGCILVITNEETVATHCVKDHTHLAFNAKDLKADPSISTLVNKGCWHYAIRGKKGRLFYDRRKDTQEWANKFKNCGGIYPDPDGGFRVFMAKVNRNSEKGVLMHAYCGTLFQQQTERCRSWVDMPQAPFNLMDFSWRLLLDFYSDDPQAKEEAAVGLMEGTIIDPIEKCRKFLRNEKCLVVINGLGSLWDWDSIKGFFYDEQHIQSIIIVGLAPSMSGREEYFLYDTTKALRLGTEEQSRLIDMEYRRILSTQKRYQEAIQWLETCQPVGRDREANILGKFVLRDRNPWTAPWSVFEPSLVSVWGIPGVGNSTLVRTVYRNEILDSSGPESWCRPNPFQAFAWVDVPSPFNLTEFAWRLLLDFYSDDPQAKETVIVSMIEEGLQVPILECCKILRTVKCLVVMDGLRSKQDWDLIKATFLTELIKSTIFVITNEEQVAMHCAENDKERAISITRLEPNAALSLLKKIAESKDRGLSAFKYIGDKCGGLPTVIAAIAQCNSRTLDSLRDNFMGTLEMDPEFHGLRPLFSWMKSYFDACSDSIKQCVFYLSIFPPNENIRLRRLLWRWIAEGYCRDTSDGRTSEENGEKFISELISWIEIQQSPSNKALCQINGFLHEYIISRTMEDNLVFALERGCSLNSTRAGQHLTIRSSWDRRDRIVYESIDFSRLRSLTVFGKWESFFICSKNVNMRLLRVLDLEDATDVTNEDLEQIATLLPRLKFLSLRGHTKITCLPSSMGGLRQLQTLDIRHTSIATLPLVITKLQKLRYIRAGTIEVWDWADGEEDRAASSAQAVTNLPAAATTPTEGSSMSCNNWARPRTLVSSFLSKLYRSGGGLDNNGPAPGVTVPADIGKLAVLHTLGVVNVNAQCTNKAIFEALKQLRQLRKLGVSGINKGNIKDFCEAISDHAHLKSLSVELDKDDNLDGSDYIPEPPKTINSLKLYGPVNNLLVWIRRHLLPILEKLKLDMTIAKPEEFCPPIRQDRDNPYFRCQHLRIRPIQDGELHIGCRWALAQVVEIQCSSKLHIKFEVFHDRRNHVWWNVRVLKVHFSGGSQSSLQISGLSNLWSLKEVWLKGYTDAHKQYMQRQIDEMDLQEHQQIPVLKLVQTRSS